MLVPFSPPPGLNSDDTTFAAAGRWADGNNVRFHEGKPQVIGGWTNSTTSTLFTSARAVHGWTNSSGSACYAVASASAPRLQVIVGGTTSDISPAGLGSSTTYSMANWGAYLLVCQKSGTIYEWQGNTGVAAAALANAPASVECMVVTPERQVIAAGCTEVSGTLNKKCIRGSDLEDNTSWTPTSSNNAFEDVLEGGGYEIRCIKLFGSYVGVWTDSAVWLGQFVGDPGQTYRWDRIANKCGAHSYESVTVIGDDAYWMSPDLRFWTWTIGSKPQPLPCPISREFRTNFSTTANRCMAWHNPRFNEIWWFYSDSRDTPASAVASRYVAVGLTDGAWFRGNVARLAVGSALTQSAPIVPYAIGTDGKFFTHEVGTEAGGELFSWHLTSADQYLNKTQQRMMIRGILPDFKDQVADISLLVNVRNRPQETATVKGPYTLTTATTKKDFRASGRIMSMKFSGSATSTYFRGGEPLIDMVPLGER